MKGRLCEICVRAIMSLLGISFDIPGIHHQGYRSFQQSANAGCLICRSALRQLNALQPRPSCDEKSFTEMRQAGGSSNNLHIRHVDGEKYREIGPFSVSALKGK
jgi:hypothetical protein